MSIRLAMLYEIACWEVNNQHERKLKCCRNKNATMDEWIHEIGLGTRDKIGVVPIVKKTVESCLRWSGHVRSRFLESSVMRLDEMDDSLIARGRGKGPRNTIGQMWFYTPHNWFHLVHN